MAHASETGRHRLAAGVRDLSSLRLPRRDGLQPGALLPHPQRRAVLRMLVVCGFISLWHMPLFFLLAGWSASSSLERGALVASLAERVLRLGVPLVAGCVLLVPRSSTWSCEAVSI